MTVAIPINNNEETIERCLDSVVAQTIDQHSIEVIIVNNGSSDNSRKILDRYESENSNMKVLHQKYSGAPGGPRNKALDKAKGEYIFFVDPTDYLGEEALERMMDVAEKHFCDIVIGKYKAMQEEPDSDVFKRNPEFFTFFGSNVMASLNAHKLFKVSLLRTQKLRFLEHTNLGEDHALTAPAYICSTGIGLVKDYDCYYITESGKAISLTKQKISFDQIHQSIKKTFETISRLDRDDKAIRKGLYHYWERLLGVEVVEEVNRRIPIGEKIENFRDLSILAADYHPQEYYSLFTPVQKIQFRILEKDCLNDYQEYTRFEDLQRDLVIREGGLYPENEMAYKIAVDEAINFTGYNILVPRVFKAYIANSTLVVEGHKYHSRLSPESQALSLKVINRKDGEVYRVKVKEGLLSEDESFPLLQVPEGKENQSYFHTEIDLPFVSRMTSVSDFDFSLFSKVGDYATEAPIGIDDTYFVPMPYFIYDAFKDAYLEATPCKNDAGAFSLELRKLEDIRDGISIAGTVFRLEKDLLRTSFEFDTDYLSFIEKVDKIHLSLDGFLISPSVVNVIFNAGISKLYAEFDISKLDGQKILNHQEALLFIEDIQLPVEKVAWKD